jgi:porin
LRTMHTKQRSLWLAICALPACAGVRATPAAAAELLSASISYDGTLAVDAGGGVQTGRTYLGNLHLKITADGSSIGLAGTSGFLDVLTIHGGHPSRLVGDAQGVNSFEGPDGTQLEELWLQRNFADSRASALVGLYDINSEFYRLQSAGLFLNSAFGIGPEFAQAGVEGPSTFPRTAAGLRLGFKPTPNSALRVALMDGVPFVRPDGSHALFRRGDGVMGVAEVAFLSRPQSIHRDHNGARDRIGRFSSLDPYTDKFAVGVWHFTGQFGEFPATTSTPTPVRRGTSGAYAIGEYQLVAKDAVFSKGIALFGALGIADSRTNRFRSHVAAGVVGSGWKLIKPTDQLGVSITRATNGAPYRRYQSGQGIPTRGSETTLELAYTTQITGKLALQPDVQYVRHPNTDPAIKSAWVLQLNASLTF